jgi:hypothetical protein
MSIVSQVANYGGRISDFQQGIKQFYVSSTSVADWIYKKLPTGLMVITPSTNKIPVLINNDLIVTGSIYNTSDARLKENIKELTEDEVDNLLKLNPICYTFKYDNSKKPHYGVLAQDIEKIYPELVEEKNYGYKTVNYQELIPIMLLKMKNMQTEIDELKEALKNR